MRRPLIAFALVFAVALAVQVLVSFGVITDADNAALATGRVVMLAPDEPDLHYCFVDPRGGGLSVGLDPGTRAVVISDPPVAEGRYRRVLVRIADGPHINLVGTCVRKHLRPAP